MVRFRIGGAGPDGRGLGWIAGLEGKRRFDQAGEIYETSVPEEIQALRRCQYVEEIVSAFASADHQVDAVRENLKLKAKAPKVWKLIKMVSDLFRG